MSNYGQVLVDKFLDSFEPLRTKLYDLESTIQNLDENSKNVEKELETVRSQTSSYVAALSTLQEEQIMLGRRTKLIEDFLERARLSDEEINTLRTCNFSHEKQIQQFFTCMNRLKKIRSLENELSTGWARTAGLQLVARTSTLQSAGYERLFLWVRSNCDILGSKAALEGSQTSTKATAMQLHHFKQGLTMLHDTPAYFEQCCVAVVNKQRVELRARFVRALVQGDGTSQPIETQAHDALRFVGDMLAWIHGTIASEIDHLWSLFDSGGDNDEGKSGEIIINASRARVEHLVPTTFDDMIRPLKVRIQQSARGEEDIVHVYRLCDLLQFYHNRLLPLLPVTSVFMVGLGAAAIKLQGRFNDLLTIESSKLLHSTTIYPSDLSVAAPVRHAVETVSNLCTARSLSLGGSVSIDDEDATTSTTSTASSTSTTSTTSTLTNINIVQVMNTMIESIQFACQASASGLNTIDRGIYVTNTVDLLVHELSSHKHMKENIEQLTLELNHHLELLANDVFSDILEQHGLSEIVQEYLNNVKLEKKQTETSEQKIQYVAQVMPKLLSFSTQLFRMDKVEKQFSLLNTPGIGIKVEQQVRIKLADMYKMLYTLLDRTNEQKEKDELYSPEQVKTLLNV